MSGFIRYARLFGALARYNLAREMAFRGNFLVKVFVEVLWLGILVFFYKVVFTKTSTVAEWSEYQYLFFVGCYFALEGVMETFFLSNCNEFADLVRTGNLDFYLLKPIDEQFLVTCRDVEWSSVPSLLMGVIVMGIALFQGGWGFHPGPMLLFAVLFGCGIAITYSFLLLLTSTSVWFKRNQSLYEMWWLFTSFMRYPREIFATEWAYVIGRFFTYVIPILLVVNVPASVMVRALEPWMVAFMGLVAVVLLVVSRRVFRYALRQYRSASS